MNPKIRRRARQGRSIAMMKSKPVFKNSDAVVFISDDLPSEIMTLTDNFKPTLESVRLANEHEKIAGHRAGSYGFDLHWYGQSEAEAIREHLIWQDELIPHGAALVGKFTNIGDVMCQVFEDVVINGSAAAVVSEDGVKPVQAHQVSAEHVNEAFRLNNLG